MQILSHHDGTIGTKISPDGGDEVTITIVDTVNDHRAVKVKQYSIHRAVHFFGKLQTLQELRLQPFISLSNNQTAGIGERPQHRHDFKTVFSRAIDKAARADVRCGKTIDHGLPAKQTKSGLEIFKSRGRFDKRAGLMRNPTNCNSHHMPLE